MKKQFVFFLLCLVCFLVLSVEAQVNNYAETLTQLQNTPWNLDYQIKIQNIKNPQFADVIRKRFFKNKFSTKQEVDEIQKRKIQIGEARINAGKASTTFKYNPKFTLKDYLLLKSESFELRKIVEQNADICLRMFRKSLRDHRLSQNDIVDAGALAFILSYEVYFGEKPSAAHLKWMRKKGRDILLKSASFQGVDDEERQRAFEIYGVLTMYSRMLQERGLKGNKEAFEESKETAEEVLKEVWGNSTETILMLPVGFIHKGQKIILEGKATQFFNFNPNIKTAKKLSGDNSQRESEYQAFLNKIYKEMFAKKMPNNDLATCGAYSFSSIYPFITGNGELNNNQIQSVYEILKKDVITSADIQAASDENKQIACEVFAIRSVVIRKQIEENPADGEKMAQQFIDDLFQAYDDEYKNYQMTAENFVKINQSITLNK